MSIRFIVIRPSKRSCPIFTRETASASWWRTWPTLSNLCRRRSPPVFDADAIDVPTALGWLYVAEGSNLGAAFLFKMARALDLDENFGARHLAGHADGRAQHWRDFTGALDTVDLDADEERRVSMGANAAFARVQALVDGRTA